jgi:predicted nucleic acid-binding Zn ribbon protein
MTATPRCHYCGYSLLASWHPRDDGFCSDDCKTAMLRYELTRAR